MAEVISAKERSRRENARSAEVVIGALDENARMLANAPTVEFAQSRGVRITELVDELRRALKRRSNGASAEEE